MYQKYIDFLVRVRSFSVPLQDAESFFGGKNELQLACNEIGNYITLDSETNTVLLTPEGMLFLDKQAALEDEMRNQRAQQREEQEEQRAYEAVASRKEHKHNYAVATYSFFLGVVSTLIVEHFDKVTGQFKNIALFFRSLFH
ncbi:MAG: hypothetical protein EOM54_13505 [Clostridia bacterium]|nr:hypothetical protein [Clostridia bacterium]